MKKLISLIGAGAMLLSLATPAFGWFPMPPKPVNKNIAIIKGNDVTAVANTGGNTQGNGVNSVVGSTVNVGGAQTQNTGAASADATSVIVANTQVGCSSCGMFGQEDVAVVKGNDVYAEANSGLNTQMNSTSNVTWSHVNVGGAQSQTTGAAEAEATGVVVVNTQLNWMVW